MTFNEIRVSDELDFRDISEEKIRTYYFPDGEKFVIHNPIALHISASGGHRIVTENGESVYVKGSWYAFAFGPVDDPRPHWKF